MKLFGTDGIRGKVGEFPITPIDMEKLGFAISKSLFKDKDGLVLISHDGRISANEIEEALRKGISKYGAYVTSLDLISTPALSYFIRKLQLNNRKDNLKIPCHIGIQITASHNSYHDNGIKIFNANGLKISEEQENEIENTFNGLKKLLENSETTWKDSNIEGITAKEVNHEYSLAAKKYLQNKVIKF